MTDMSRKPRQEVPGGIHHVTSRGNNRAVIFHSDGERRYFLAKYARAVSRHGWNSLCYCLMDNHIHLVLETPEPNLGDGMGELLTAFVQGVHRRRGTSGHILGGRFDSRPVDSDRHLAAVLRYVALNPVNANLCATPEDWQWSSHIAMLRRAPGPLVAVERVDELLGVWGRPAGERYAALFDEQGEFGSWADATTPDPPRPPLPELLSRGISAEVLREARWTYGYPVIEIAAATGLSNATISRRTTGRR